MVMVALITMFHPHTETCTSETKMVKAVKCLVVNITNTERKVKERKVYGKNQIFQICHIASQSSEDRQDLSC